MLKRPPLAQHVMKNVFFDTCVYHQPGIDLLVEVIDIDNILFGSEMVGAVRGIDPGDRPLLRRHEALHRRAADCGRGQAAHLRAQRAARVSAPGHAAEGERTYEPVPDGSRLARLHPSAEQAGVQAAARRGRRALSRVRSRRRVSVCAGAQVHAVRCVEGEAVGAARLSRLRAQRDRAGDVSRRRQSRAGRCAARVERPRARRRDGDEPMSPTSSCASSMRRACAACASISSSGWWISTPREVLMAIAERIAAARLAHRHLLRSAGSAGAVRLLRVAADDRGRRSHGAA